MTLALHVVGLPHVQTDGTFVACAYAQKVIKFCNMMYDRGHRVYLYSGDRNVARCTEHIQCFTEDERAAALGETHYTDAPYDGNLPHWKAFNDNVAINVSMRFQRGDFLCLITGDPHKALVAAIPDIIPVEFGVGYAGTITKMRVWESYAWMHTCYGSKYKKPHDIDGSQFDTVIPNYFDVSEFPFCERPKDYYLFIGRLIERKGYRMAEAVCARLNAKLVLAGPGRFVGRGQHIGVIDHVTRGKVMSEARAVFVPTQYIEPFGAVAVEAMLCGTPVICSDWGAFTETVQHGITGFRCAGFHEYLGATTAVERLDRAAIREYAVKNYSLEAAAVKYERYFARLQRLLT